MKLKLKEIIQLGNSLKVIGQKELPIKVSYKLAKILRKLDTQTKIIEEKRVSLIKKYGTEDEKKNFSILETDKESLDKFYAEYNELLDIEEDMDLPTISIEEFGGISIAPSLLASADKIIID